MNEEKRLAIDNLQVLCEIFSKNSNMFDGDLPIWEVKEV
jgi:hypothetical protein